MAALDPVAFVRSTPPFDSLPPDLFEGAARSLEVIYYPTGTKLVTVGEDPLQHLYVIRSGMLKTTTLAADGPGSLAEALRTPGPRIVVFEVAGESTPARSSARRARSSAGRS